MTTRFAILHHVAAQGEHWDLMLESGGVLLTWQLDGRPESAASLPIGARRLPDHRMRYLTYEGPISGDRGTVRRVDQGSVEITELTDSVCLFRLAGGHLTGAFELTWDEQGGALSATTLH